MNPVAKAYLELLKPRITGLVLVSTTFGYFLAGKGIGSWLQLWVLLVGMGARAAVDADLLRMGRGQPVQLAILGRHVHHRRAGHRADRGTATTP